MALKCPPVGLVAAHSGLRVPPKVAAPWYGTPEHHAWRDEVVKRANGMCQAPGCGRVGVRLFADHVVEIKDGGSKTDLRNGQALCGRCHSRKTVAARAARMGRGV